MLYVVLPLVVVLFALIFKMSQMNNRPPQAYYLRKKRGQTAAFMDEGDSRPIDTMLEWPPPR